jgi:hypothetical protein
MNEIIKEDDVRSPKVIIKNSEPLIKRDASKPQFMPGKIFKTTNTDQSSGTIYLKKKTE